MSLKAALQLEDYLLKRIADFQIQSNVNSNSIDKERFFRLIEAEIKSRIADIWARKLRAENKGFYTISSSGHESNVVLGDLLRKTDPCLLHYRSGALMMRRLEESRPGPLFKTLISMTASVRDDVCQGRHKVWGDHDSFVLPQTSTIASHLPKSVGMAFALAKFKLLKNKKVPEDSIIVCSFGDGSINHASAQTAFNTASWVSYQNLPLPILFVCEDNGLAISVKSPKNWVENSIKNKPGFNYFKCDGNQLENCFNTAKEAIDFCRKNRKPTFLHIKTVRLLGHAGSDMEAAYRSTIEIQKGLDEDPLFAHICQGLNASAFTKEDILDLWQSTQDQAEKIALAAAESRKFKTADEVMESITINDPKAVKISTQAIPDQEKRYKIYKNTKNFPEKQEEKTMAQLLNWGLTDIMAANEEVLVFGEDVAKKGGVYGITRDLYKHFGAGRVFNTLLDETSILGLATGASLMGFLACPEIQYLAYFHNAEDQIRSEAATQSFFSGGKVTNPMVIRMASFAYQKGFGGHFHNDNSLAVLRDIPGIRIAVPSRGDDAVKMLRTCFASAKSEKRIVFFLEPIALYHRRDLYEEGDKEFCFNYPSPNEAIELGEGKIYNPGHKDVLIITYANGVLMALNAAKKLSEEHQINSRILDLRWLAPLNFEGILKACEGIKEVVVFDECRQTGNVNEEIAAYLFEKRPELTLTRLCGHDSYLPLGPAADLVLANSEELVKRVLCLKENNKINSKAE